MVGQRREGAHFIKKMTFQAFPQSFPCPPSLSPSKLPFPATSLFRPGPFLLKKTIATAVQQILTSLRVSRSH